MKASEQVTVSRIEPWSEVVIKLFGHFNMISHRWLHEQNPVNPDDLAWFSFQTTGMMICQGIILMSAVIEQGAVIIGHASKEITDMIQPTVMPGQLWLTFRIKLYRSSVENHTTTLLCAENEYIPFPEFRFRSFVEQLQFFSLCIHLHRIGGKEVWLGRVF